MRKLGTVSRIIEKPLLAASNVLMGLIIILIFTEVVSRYIFGQSHGFMEEFSKWSQIWITYLMLAVVEKGRRHITVDVLFRRLPTRYQTILLVTIDIITLFFAIALVWSGVEFCQIVKALDYTTALEISVPMWIVRLCVPIGGIFLAFFSFEHLISDIRSLDKRTEGEK